MRRLVLALALGLLAGCVDPQPVAPKIQGVDGDKFSQDITIRGHAIFENPFFGMKKEWYLRTFINKKTMKATTHLYIDINYDGDWMHFYAAADDSAKELTTTPIASSVGSCAAGSCTLYETIGVEIDEAELRDRANSGMQIKLSARSGNAIILPVSSVQITLQLQEIDRIKSGK